MTLATSFYLGGGALQRDNGSGPDTPVMKPAWHSDLTPQEVQAIMDLPNSGGNKHPMKVALLKAYNEAGILLESADVQALHDRFWQEPFPYADINYGKGGLHEVPPGLQTWAPTRVSRWSRITNKYSKGTSIIRLKHPDAADNSPRALFHYRDDDAVVKMDSLTGIPELTGLQLFGDRKSLSNARQAAETEHGVWLPEPTAGSDGKTDGIHMQTIVAQGFNGDGFRSDRYHNAIRAMDSRWVDNKGAGIRVKKTSDSKWFNLSAGRNEEVQVEFDDCASPQVIGFDLWPPGNSKFTGLYTANLLSCANYRFAFGELNGMTNITGDNSQVGSDKRYKNQNGLFFGAVIKASLDTYMGTQYVGGGGAVAYDQIVKTRSASGINYALTSFTIGEFAAYDTNLPKFIWDVAPDGGGAASEAGYVALTSPTLIDAERTAASDKVVVPFKQHWAKDPTRVIWRTNKPGQLLILPTATAAVNLLALTGSTQALLKRLFPLCYCGMNDANKLTDGNDSTTFNAPATAGTLPTGYGYFLVLW